MLRYYLLCLWLKTIQSQTVLMLEIAKCGNCCPQHQALVFTYETPIDSHTSEEATTILQDINNWQCRDPRNVPRTLIADTAREKTPFNRYLEDPNTRGGDDNNKPNMDPETPEDKPTKPLDNPPPPPPKCFYKRGDVTSRCPQSEDRSSVDAANDACKQSRLICGNQKQNLKCVAIPSASKLMPAFAGCGVKMNSTQILVYFNCPKTNCIRPTKPEKKPKGYCKYKGEKNFKQKSKKCNGDRPFGTVSSCSANACRFEKEVFGTEQSSSKSEFCEAVKSGALTHKEMYEFCKLATTKSECTQCSENCKKERVNNITKIYETSCDVLPHSAAATSTCPKGMIAHDNNCYFLEKSFALRSQALHLCNAAASRLYGIEQGLAKVATLNKENHQCVSVALLTQQKGSVAKSNGLAPWCKPPPFSFATPRAWIGLKIIKGIDQGPKWEDGTF